MNELAIKQQESLAVSDSTKELILSGVSENTLQAYRRALLELDRSISDEGTISDQLSEAKALEIPLVI